MMRTWPLLLLLLMLGCEATTQTQVVQPMIVRLTPYSSAAVSVSSQGGKWDTVAADVKQQLMVDLRQAMLFQEVVDVPETGEGVPPDRVNVLVRITQVRAVDPTLRWYAGPLAGQAQIVATATVLDGSGIELGKAEFNALSEAETTRTGTTEDVVRQISDQITRWIAAYK